ncbi:MAG: hypothetical protein WCK01_00270 [Candidatus Uhrbacteria bacterium]
MNPFDHAPHIETKRLEVIYHHFIDKTGKETGEFEAIRLLPDGTVDLSEMKDQRRAQTWQSMGIEPKGAFEPVYPKDGERFLHALLGMNDQTWRFHRHE